MNNSFKFLTLGAFALCFAATSCSDDNDEPNPGNKDAGEVNPATVFTNGLPSSVGRYAITKNGDGLVTKIVAGEEVTTFNYDPILSKSRAAARPTDYDMTMNVEWGSDKGGVDFYIKLNAQGYIEYAFEEDENEYNGITYNEWWFKYNNKGQLVEMKRTELDNEVTTITYNADGDIVSIAIRDDEEGLKKTATVSYTDAAHTSPILNKSGITLYYDSFRINMHEMAPAYYAGLLGKGTTHLPLTNKEVYYGLTANYTFIWKFNSSDMPVKFTCLYTNRYGTSTFVPKIIKW